MKLIRNMSTLEAVYDFCYNVLELNKSAKTDAMAERIFKEETKLYAFDRKRSTYFSRENRVRNYVSDEEREALRLRIVNELMTLKRIKEEEISLGNGGLLPESGKVKRERKFYMIIGNAASGKTGIAETLADLTDSILIDSDIAKRKFPEYKLGPMYVHDEANFVVRPSEDFQVFKKNVMTQSFNNGYNIVYTHIGGKFDEVKDFIKVIKKQNYDIILILVELSRAEACWRAYRRFEKNDRYIQLSRILDENADSSAITYYKCIENNLVERYVHLDTDVPVEEKFKVIKNENSGLDFNLDIWYINKKEVIKREGKSKK